MDASGHEVNYSNIGYYTLHGVWIAECRRKRVQEDTSPEVDRDPRVDSTTEQGNECDLR